MAKIVFTGKLWRLFVQERCRYKAAYGGRGSAKCLALGTQVIMADGSLRAVEDVHAGDLVMGPDSGARRVLFITSGTGQLYRVRQTSGIDYVVNDEHILSVKKSQSAKNDASPQPNGRMRRPNGRYPGWPDVTNIGVQDYAQQSKRWRSHFRGYRAGLIHFDSQSTTVDPYFLGLWLGDGTARELQITNPDIEIIEWIERYATSVGARASVKNIRGSAAKSIGVVYGAGNKSPLWSQFLDLGLKYNKHIPQHYIANSEHVRLRLLAGILDADAHCARNGYIIAQVNEALARQIKYLADTLGFRTSIFKRQTVCCNNGVKGVAWYVGINGDTWRIPCQVKRKQVHREDVHKNKDFLLSMLSVEDAGIGEWAGFAVDGDHLFLLADGTVTHNSWAAGAAVIFRAFNETLHILCAREFQRSIADSVHHLLEVQIDRLGLAAYFDVQKTTIRCRTSGSSIIFAGLKHNIRSLKSLEGVDLCWVEEAEAVSNDSWQHLIPTIRKPGSEIWVTFNPDQESDPTYRRFVPGQSDFDPARTKSEMVSWRDNPALPDVLKAELEHLRRTDPDAYHHVWEGGCWTRSDAQVFNGKWVVDDFAPVTGKPDASANWQGPYFGADWGFSTDPTALVKLWVHGKRLYIEHEAYKVGCDIVDTPKLFDTVPDSRRYVIRADCARPETINHMNRAKFRCEGAIKWTGNVEDGLTYLRSFERIVIHPRCKHAAEEFRLYSYKTDKLTNDVLPDLKPGHDHIIDAIRYGLGPLIRPRTAPRRGSIPDASRFI
jgi:phage terminase large subunit